MAAGATGCGRRPAADGRPTIRIAFRPGLSMSGLYIAVEAGYFEEEGLDVTLIQFPNTPQIIPLLADGEVDVLPAGLNVATINAVARGIRIRIVAGREVASDSCGEANTLYASARQFPNGIQDLRQLKGKRVSIRSRQTSAEFALDTLLSTVGMTAGDVELVFLRQADGAAALLSGRIDALVSSHFENNPDAVSGEYTKGLGLADILPGHQRSFTMFGPSLLEGDRETGVRVLLAYLRGANDFLNGRTAKAIDELARASGADPAAARNGCRATFVPDGAIDRASVERTIAWAHRKGYSPRQIQADDIIDSSFVQEAWRRFQERNAAG
jgi:NitT/TauT family transport system substrate-binding protein